MPAMQRSGLLLAAGGDVLAKYGTLVRRYQIPQLGGEGGKEVFTRAGPALGISKGGILVPVANNFPAVDYLTDPVTGLVQAYLRLDGPATQKLTASEDLSNVGWFKSGTTIPSINNPSPRGGDPTASFVREDASNGLHFISQDFNRAVNGNTVGVTAFFKANGRTKALWRIPGIANESSTYDVNIDLAAGTAVISAGGTAAGTFVEIIPLGSGYFAVTAYGVPSTGATFASFRVYFKDNLGSLSYAGDGASGMYIWGCLATDNTIAGSYWGITAARLADVMAAPYYTAPQAGDWLYLRLRENGGGFTNGYPTILALGDGPTLPTMRLIGTNLNVANTYGASFWNTANVERDMAGGVMGNVIELFCGLDPNLNFLSQLAVNGAAGALGSTPIAQALPAAWGGGFKVTLGGPARISRALHGLGCGTAVATLADARAIPV